MTLKTFYAKTKPTPKQELYESVDHVPAADWAKVAGTKNVYLSLAYLEALEKALVGKIDFRYTLFYSEDREPIAVSYIQIMHYEDNESRYTDSFCHISDKIKNKLLGIYSARLLICGNVFASGENGFAYTSALTPKAAFALLSKSMMQLAQEKDNNGEISFGLLKEFWPNTLQHSDTLESNNFKGFEIDVNMVLKLQPQWKSFEDYLNDMTTKYRTKAKGVLKKSAALRIENLDLEQVIQHKDRIETLYAAVLEKAEFKFGELNAQAFVNFKANLKDQFILKGYFLEDKLVGFSSAFMCHEIGDANYVGLDYEYNKDYAVYQRMLYDLVELAIQQNLKELRLGRTAELVKSSIGAEPVNMKLYLRHRNSISNTLIGPMISSIKPSAFELRPPFKKEIA